MALCATLHRVKDKSPPHLPCRASRLPHNPHPTPTADLTSAPTHPPPASTTTMPRLIDLPLEILLEILFYNALAQNRLPAAVHPLNALALTNKHLCTVVEEYCRNRLKKYANFTPPRSRAFSCRRKWLAETCQFCKRKSTRRAILYGGLTCCRMCDKQYFPKMVRTCTLSPPLSLSLQKDSGEVFRR